MESRRTEVVIETDERWVIRFPRRAASILCPQCEVEVWMITLDEAATLTLMSARAIYRGVEAGLIHYAEMIGGFLVVCPYSILEMAREEKTAPALAPLSRVRGRGRREKDHD